MSRTKKKSFRLIRGGRGGGVLSKRDALANLHTQLPIVFYYTAGRASLLGCLKEQSPERRIPF